MAARLLPGGRSVKSRRRWWPMADAPRKFTAKMAAAYRDGHAAAEWERRKPAKPACDGREIRKRAIRSFFDDMVPGIGSVPSSFKKYRHELHRGAFVIGWVD